MKLSRLQFLRLAAGTAALPAMSHIARAQTYPTRPVRVIVGFAAGGAADIVARRIGQWLSERLGQQIVVESRAGAASNIATEAVVQARADGYTLLMCTSANTINDTFYQKLNFNFTRDLVPVATIVDSPLVMEVNPSVAARTVPELIAYAKANPGKINMASAGTGTVNHIAGELFKMMTGIDMVHVPYRGDSSAITDLLGGQVQVFFSTLASSIEYIRAGNPRALAVTTASRSSALPDIPAMGEFLPGYEASVWFGLCVPRGTPPAIIDRLSRETNAGLADLKLKAAFADLGLTVRPGTPAEFGKIVADETEKWAKVIRAANIKPD
jgi:tripartite-type tricarboxylate transporter receptor subunit TctC